MNEVGLTLGLAVTSFIAGVIWGWATRPKKVARAKPLIARIKKGKAGKWRFVIEGEEGILAVSSITGWRSFWHAENVLKNLEGRKIVIAGDPPDETKEKEK